MGNQLGTTQRTNVEELESSEHRNSHHDIEQGSNLSNSTPSSTEVRTNSDNIEGENNNAARGIYFGAPFFLRMRSNSGTPVMNQANTNNAARGWPFSNVRPDLTFLSSLSNVTTRAPTPNLHQTVTVKCPVNLNRNSLQLIPIDDEKKKYRVQFIFDCTENCSVRVYYGVTEQGIVSADEPNFTAVKLTSPIRYERGLSQLYEQGPEEHLDISLLKEDELEMNAEQGYYPVVIVIQADYPKENDEIKSVKLTSSPSQSSILPRVSCQMTYATLIHCTDDSYVIKVMKQKILCNGRSYVVHEIFGLENGENETGKDCVICMTEPRDTAMLPCRHLCLCAGCAEVLRQQSNKCPICRSVVKHMVEIKISKQTNNIESVDSNQLENDSSEEEELILKKSTNQSKSVPNAQNEMQIEAQ